MSKPHDITAMSADEIKVLLEGRDKPLLCFVPWENIVLIQSRVETNFELVTEYQGNLRDGDTLPPSKGIFVHSLNRCCLFDGIHTGHARVNLGAGAIPVMLKLGTKTEAEMAASGANATHGAKRTNEDKRHAAELLLRNPELAGYSNRRLASIAKISSQLVEDVRVKLENDPDNPVQRTKKRRVQRNGVEYEVDAPATKTKTAPKTKSPSFKTTAKRIVDFLNEQLQPYPTEEQTNICKLVIESIQTSSSLS